MGTESTIKQDVRLLLHQKKMKVVLFLTLALVASALALPLCTGPECGSMEEVDTSTNNMTTIIIKLGNDTDFKMTVPDHLSKLEARWFLMVGKSAIDRAWARGFITKARRDGALKKLKEALDKLVDKENNALIVAEALSEVFSLLNGGASNADIIIDLTNKSQIVIHVPDHLSQGAADMIFSVGSKMIDGEVQRGTITKEKGEAAKKKLKGQLQKLVDKLAILSAEIDIEVTETVKIHLTVPDHLAKAQADMIFKMGSQMINHEVSAGRATKEQGDAAIKKLREELDKLMVTGEAVKNIEDYLSMSMTYDDEEMLANGFDDLWKKLIDWLNTKGHAGVIIGKLLNKYKGKVEDMLKKILKTEAQELIGLIEKIKADIIKIINGGHIDVDVMNDEEELESFLDDLWKKFIDWLNTKGHAGVIIGKLLNKYKGKVEDMLKKILKTEAQELIGLIEKIKADIIKIINGGHIDVDTMNDEEDALANPFDDLWNTIINWLNKHGHVGQIAAKLLNKYKGKVNDMLKKILKTEAQELIKLIDDIKADIIKIIRGGHIDVDVMNDEEELESFLDDWWQKFIDWLNKKGRAGQISAKLFIKYKGKIEAMLAKILKTEAAELIHLIERLRDDVIKIIMGGTIAPKTVDLIM